MGRPRLYSDEERRKKRRLKSAQWRERNLERSREIVRESERRRNAKRAIKEGREPGLIGRPPILTEDEKRSKHAARIYQQFLDNKEVWRERARNRQRRVRAELSAGTYSPQLKRKFSEDERKRKWREMSANRRARLRGAEGSHTKEDIEQIMRRQKGRCMVCLTKLSGKNWHVDHYIALAAGGSNGPGNLRILCESCNTSKGAKHPIDFAIGKGLLCF